MLIQYINLSSSENLSKAKAIKLIKYVDSYFEIVQSKPSSLELNIYPIKMEI